ncbi:ABC transporter permease [Ferdinandcohnia sp. SAFN-114]|uniref:ABC transporter permease n=1 Tax=Ferdinandcohnia sp. SAFN-114 TaxID=3387275 RepID=UPI003F81BD7D
MLLFIVKRILAAIPLLFLISIIAFLLVNLMPGNPVDMMIDTTITGSELEKKKEQLGLNDPLYIQYANWLKEIVTGNLGYSFSKGAPVTELIMDRVPATLLLMGVSLILSLLIAIPVGVLSATKQYSTWDYSLTFLTLAGVSIPTFFLGLSFIYIFAVKLGMFPTGMMGTPGVEPSFLDTAKHLVLPMTVLGLNGAAVYTRYMRSSMLEIIKQDYIRTARAKGSKERKVIFVHALRNGLIPIITLLGLSIPTLFGGAVITEQIFSWPGVGKLMVDSVFSRDYPVLMALILITSFLVVVGSLLADILYSLVDPKVKLR